MKELETLLAPPPRMRRFRDFLGGITRGQNVGGYPKHHFAHVDYSETGSDLPVRVEFAGTDEAIAGFFRTTTDRDMLAVEYVLAGEVAFRQDGKDYCASSNEVLFCQPLSEFSLAVGPCGTYEKMVVAMSGTLLGEMLSQLGLRSLHHYVPTDAAKIRSRMEHICDMLAAQLRDVPAMSAAAYELLIAISRDLGASEIPETMRNALALIEERLHTSLRLPDLAAHCGQSESSLCRLFSERFGSSPIAYYLQRKIRFAEHLLRNDNLSIKEVAYSLGYRDPFYFSAEFKKRTGHSPSAYRKLHAAD